MDPAHDLLLSIAVDALDRRDTPRAAAWVFHRGALGDSILLWPLLRVLRAGHGSVHLVADGSKAALAARHTGVIVLDAESHRFNALWHDPAPPPIDPDATLVLAFVPTDSPWSRGAHAAFPRARLVCLDTRPDALAARRIAALAPWAVAPPRAHAHGPIVAHVGAGAECKRWPMNCWESLVRDLRRPVRVLAGEVEQERFSPADRAAFARIGGEFIHDLPTLEARLTDAAGFVGADTGPTHLAAALGARTFAVFGPTDPARWSPVGACVRTIVPEVGECWPTPERVLAAIDAD